jgi:predicted ATP-binding protein involved in virulence
MDISGKLANNLQTLRAEIVDKEKKPLNNFEIKEIRITDLFGSIPKHIIPLKEGGITFIHGPNGCGKTTCLRLISAVFNLEVPTLMEINFSSIEIEKSDGRTLRVTKAIKLLREKRKIPEITFTLDKNKPYSLSRDLSDARVSLSDIVDLVPGISRIGAREWIDRNQGIKLDFDELIEKYPVLVPFGSNKKKPEWLEEFTGSINLHFIKTQRLLKVDFPSLKRHRQDEQSISDVIQLYSNEIKDSINKKLAEQAAMSQGHDRSFPQRLLSLNIDDTVSETEIRKLYADTEQKIQKLVQAGLIDKQDNIALPQQAFEDTERRVLSLYLQDVNTKLAVFDDLQRKIETFLDVINGKFKTKKFSVNRESGFSFYTGISKKNSLSPTQLSSGEQHQIVLFYELIFKASENSFFLIDEPEISLHVDWQRMFLDDIHKIAQLGDRQFLIATHSPQIIGNYRHLAVALNEGILDE